MTKSEIISISNSLIKIGDLVCYEEGKELEIKIATSNVDKQGNFNAVLLYNNFKFEDSTIGQSSKCNIDDYIKFKGEIKLISE